MLLGLGDTPAVTARVMIPRKTHLVDTSRSHAGIFVFPVAHAFWKGATTVTNRIKKKDYENMSTNI